MFWATLLWAGALAVAIPWWIHRIRRPSSKIVPFSSLAILKTGQVRSTRRRKKEGSFLRWIRTGALLSLALALAVAAGEPPFGTVSDETSPTAGLVGDEPERHTAFESAEQRRGALMEHGVSEPYPDRSEEGAICGGVSWVVAHSVSGAFERPLTAALTLLSEEALPCLVVEQADNPEYWYLQQRMGEAEPAREIWVQQMCETCGRLTVSDREWIERGGQLILFSGLEAEWVALNRWMATSGLNLRVVPAPAGMQITSEQVVSWMGSRLFASGVEAPVLHLPMRQPPGIIEGSGSDVDTDVEDVLLRAEGGEALVQRVRLGQGWLVLSVLPWESDRQGWLYHPLFPFMVHSFLEPPPGFMDAWTMEQGGAPLPPEESREEMVRPESGSVPAWPASTGWLVLALLLLLTESLADRYLNRVSGAPTESHRAGN